MGICMQLFSITKCTLWHSLQGIVNKRCVCVCVALLFAFMLVKSFLLQVVFLLSFNSYCPPVLLQAALRSTTSHRPYATLNCHAHIHAQQCETMFLCHSVTHTHKNFSANTSNVNSLTFITLTHFSISLLQTHTHSVEQCDIHKEIKMPAAHEKSIQPWRRKRPQ